MLLLSVMGNVRFSGCITAIETRLLGCIFRGRIEEAMEIRRAFIGAGFVVAAVVVTVFSLSITAVGTMLLIWRPEGGKTFVILLSGGLGLSLDGNKGGFFSDVGPF